METGETPTTVNRESKFYAVSPAKFVAMSVCTFGLYGIYWSYRNWEAIKEIEGSSILPLARAIFYPLWHYPLLTGLNRTLESETLSSGAYRGLLAAIVLIPGLMWNLPDPYWLVSMLTFIGFLPALHAIRRADSTGVIHGRFLHPSNLIAYLVGGPLLVFTVMSSISFLPSTMVVTGDRLWDRDVAYLRDAKILGPDEEIDYFYSLGFWSIKEDGQFISDAYVTSYYQDPNTGELYFVYASYSEIKDINVVWAKTLLDSTVVEITADDDRQFELWLSSEAGGDKRFVQAMMQNWRAAKGFESGSGN